MLLIQLKEYIEKQSFSLYLRLSIYKDQSCYVEYTIQKEILVVSYNVVDKKLYIYFRSKNNIFFSDYFKDIGFVLKKNMLILSIDDNLNNVKIIYYTVLERIEAKLKHKSLFVSPYTDKGIEICGDYLDDYNNSIAAPYYKEKIGKCFFMGVNNSLKINPDSKIPLDVTIYFKGNNSRIILGANVLIKGKIELCSNSLFIVNNDVLCQSEISIYVENESYIQIEDNSVLSDRIIKTKYRDRLVIKNNKALS